MYSFPKYYVYSYLVYLYKYQKNYTIYEYFVFNLAEYNKTIPDQHRLKTEYELHDIFDFCVKEGYLATFSGLEYVCYTLPYGRLFVEEHKYVKPTIKEYSILESCS